MGEIAVKLLNELDNLGFPGVVIVLLVTAVIALWRQNLAERKRCDVLVEKMNVMSRETIIMIERIIGSRQ